MKKLLKSILTTAVGFMTAFGFVISSALAIELDDATRTVALTSTKAVTLTPEQVKRGKNQSLKFIQVLRVQIFSLKCVH